MEYKNVSYVSLNRSDIFSAEDLGLLKAIGKNYYNGKKPDRELANNLSLKWMPWRTTASWFYGEV